MKSGPVKVLFIMGWTRSGSTILDNVLGELDGFFSAGELHYLWERGLLENRLCGCGRVVPSCEIWSAVLAQLGDLPDPETVMRWQRDSVRVRHTRRLLKRQS